ncbi:MAG: purine-nucleoside phosphorylase [Desulfobacterales bacterium]|nr:purine-nucleoside phosphorylase [Desulfobacterales bacterium]
MNDKSYKAKVMESALFLKEKTSINPEIGILAGTGLGDCADSVKTDFEIKYDDIPNFPVSTVESHEGKLIFGTLNGKEIIVMQGRFHLYEGYTPLEVTFPVRVMQEMGVGSLIVTNASGGLNLTFNEGDIMIITDHVNLTGSNPLTGQNVDSWGLRFPDMINAYDKKLVDLAFEKGKSLSIQIQKGFYAGLPGPVLETPAEMRYLKTIGCDAVGFSTIHEVITGVHAGMKILGLSVIANINDPENPEPATLESVVSVMQGTAGKVDQLISSILKDSF